MSFFDVQITEIIRENEIFTTSVYRKHTLVKFIHILMAF